MGNIDFNVVRKRKFDDPIMEKVQNESINLTCTQTDKLIEEFKKLPESHNGQYINSDLMKMLYRNYKESKENRNRFNLAVSNSAACLANEYYERQIKSKNIDKCIYICRTIWCW